MPWGDFISDCVPGQPVSSARHNSIRDQVTHIVPTMAQLPNDVADGSVAIVGDKENRLHVRRGGRWWSTRLIIGGAKTTDSNGLVTFTGTELGFVQLTGAIAEVSGGSAAVTTVGFSGFAVLPGTPGSVIIRAFRLVSGGGVDSLVNVTQSSARTYNIYAEGYVT
jgi:hypothetical protein